MGFKTVTLTDPGLLDNTSLSQDVYRREFGTWASSNTSGIKYTTSESENFIIEEITEPVDIGDPSEENNLQRYKQTVTMVEKGTVSLLAEWPIKVNTSLGMGVVRTYIDNITTVLTNYTAEEALVSNSNIDTDVGVDYVYNYYDARYERQLDLTANHETIPSLYAMLDDSTRAGTGDFIGDIDILKAPTARRLRKNRVNYEATQRVNFKNQIVPIENTPLLADYAGSRYLFPMFSEIKIKMDENNEIAGILDDSNLGVLLTRDVEYIPSPITVDGIPASQDPAETVTTENITYSNSVIDALGAEIHDVFTSPATSVNLVDWNDIDSPNWWSDNPYPEGYMTIGPDTTSGAQSTFGNAVIIGVGQNTLFDGLIELAGRKKRTFQDLLDGKEAYSETLMYKVAKHLGSDPTTSSPTQTYHFMNSSELHEFLTKDRKLIFCDTQVKYGEEYSYVVTAYQVVLGVEYTYSNRTTYQESRPSPVGAGAATFNVAKFDFEATPVAKLIEIPLFMSTGKILDNPPLDPEVDFIPFMGSPNKLLIRFDTKSGIINTEPIALTDEEQENFDQTALNQRSTDGRITFKTDDPATAFSIYRTRIKPLDYTSFPTRPFRTVSTGGPDSRNKLQASSAGIMVRQRPNIKYYYMFRTVDIHGGLSNPSIVYEIELYNDGGAGYPIIRQYDFTQVDPKTPTKSARKIIQIVPRITQAYLNESASGLIDASGNLSSARNKNIVLGVEDEPLFGKKFKVRLTSKTTGKKVDINIDFRKKKIRSETE